MTAVNSYCHLLVVKVHIEIIAEGQRAVPHYPSQGQVYGAVV